MRASFHSTVDMPLQQLMDFEQKARTQEQSILEHFLQNPHEWLSPYDVLDRLFKGNLLKLNSVRRAMSNLSDPSRHNPPKLIKTSKTVMSRAHAPNCLWRLNNGS